MKDKAISISRVLPPLAPNRAWEIESLYLKVLEYANYSLRSVLAGRLSEHLGASIFVAAMNGRTVGAAATLYNLVCPGDAILGPVVVDEKHRGRGIGRRLVQRSVRYLKAIGCRGVYLGVNGENRAAALYRRLGFQPYQGIVLRRTLKPEETHLRMTRITIRNVDWGDFVSTSVLSVAPAAMYAFDHVKGLISSRYAPPQRFLSVFPEMMGSVERHGGCASVLTDPERNVLGIAHIHKPYPHAETHIGILDLFVQDHVLSHAVSLLRHVMERSGHLGFAKLIGYVLECDDVKRRVLETLNPRSTRKLPGHFVLDGEEKAVLLYEWKG